METRFNIIAAILVVSGICNPVGASGPKANMVTPKVVNGDAVPDGKYKFVTAIQKVDIKEQGIPTGHWCGASLLSPNFILTAAHCMTDTNNDGQLEIMEANLFRAVAGMTVYGKNQGQERRIDEIYVHPLYEEFGAGSAYDVAVLRLDRKVTGLPKVKLAKAGEDAPGIVATVAGWGSIVAWYADYPEEYTPEPVFPLEMRAVDLPIIDDQSCADIYKEGFGFDRNLQICTFLPARGDCQGDSGGPLFRKINGRIVQVGIVSGGQGCADPSGPNLYTRVSSPAIREFIKSVISP